MCGSDLIADLVDTSQDTVGDDCQKKEAQRQASIGCKANILSWGR